MLSFAPVGQTNFKISLETPNTLHAYFWNMFRVRSRRFDGGRAAGSDGRPDFSERRLSNRPADALDNFYNGERQYRRQPPYRFLQHHRRHGEPGGSTERRRKLIYGTAGGGRDRAK